jgi:predicted permease
MSGLLQDFRYAMRQLRKSPGFTAVAVTTLALGIGANTAVFSVIDAVMLRPLPYAQPERLIEAQSVDSQSFKPSTISYPDFFDWRSQNRTLEHLVSYHDASLALTGLERPVHLDGEIVSWDLAQALGINPELGRGFMPDEEKQGTRVLLISHALWVAQFGADKSILGRAVNLSGNLYTVIGVMPPSFRFPVTSPENSFWTTLAMDNDPAEPKPNTSNRGNHLLHVFGRLEPGATATQVEKDLQNIAANLARQYPKTNTGYESVRVEGEVAALVGDARTPLLVVLGAVALVLLIACGNIANLMLARMRERQREIAIRSALGAARMRIISQLLAESIALSAIGGLVGCGLAFLCTPAILSLIGDSIPRAADARVDLRVLAFSAVVSSVAGIVFGIVPAIAASKTDLAGTLKESGRSNISGHDWLRSSLIVGQVAVGLLLTAGAGLLITSFSNLLRTNQGFNPDHLLTFLFETPDSLYKDKRPQFYRDYFEKLRALPGVEAAAGVLILPMTDSDIDLSFENREHPVPEGEQSSAEFTPISPEFFKTMQVPLLEGRDFSDRDDMNAPQVLIVNQAFAQKYFSGEEALGKKLKPGAGNGRPGGPPWREIVGVVGNVRQSVTQREMRPTMYVPASQLSTWCCMYSVVRTSVDPLSLEPMVRKLVSSMDNDIPITEVHAMRDLMGNELAQPRFAMALLATFAGLAISLTIVGLYGVMTYSVTRRTREIGVRMALGAPRAVVLTMVLRHAAKLLAMGIAVGIVAVMASASVLQSMLYGTGSRDPVVLTLVCVGVAFAGLVAAYIPAFRAAKVDPMVALRYE